MKKSAKFIMAVALISLVALDSCNKSDNPPDNTDVRTKFVADWSCVEQGGMTYPVSISLDSNNSSQVLIGNFHFFGSGIKATAIATSNALTIPTQEICSNTVHGSGTLVNSNKINMLYYVNNHSTIDTVSATYTK
jgi:hypothetical protein